MRIPLTKGQVALIDKRDYPLIKPYNWTVVRKRTPSGFTNCYAYSWDPIKKRIVYMHHKIIGRPPHRMYADHINGNSLDNRRCNLRFVTAAQNIAGGKKSPYKTSKYKGVSWNKARSYWEASIMVNYHKQWLGSYHYEIQAARAYRDAAELVWGSYARNFKEA